MLTKNNILLFLKNNQGELKKIYHVSKIGLFGSFARDDQSEKSDIDLMVEFDEKVEDIFEVKYKLKEYLKKNFNRNIEITRKKYLKSFAKETILKETLYVE